MNYQYSSGKLRGLGDWIKDNPVTAIVAVAVTLLFAVLIYAKVGPQSFVSKEGGYRIACPRGWEMRVGPAYKNVSFYRDRYQGFDRAIIKMEVSIGNPYGKTAVDFLSNGILPQVEHSFGLEQDDNVQFLRIPVEVMRDGRLWATMGFSLRKNNEEQVLYATEANDDIYLLTLSSIGTHQADDKAVFEKILKSFEVSRIIRKKYL